MADQDIIRALRTQNPHNTDEVCDLMGAAARILEEDWELHKSVKRVLEWCEAYIGKAQSEGFYDGCVVSGEKCLEFIKQVRKDL
jgi:hypothetical protein